MNSTSIFSFLRPKAIVKSVANHTVKPLGTYIDRMINAIKLTTQLEQSLNNPSENQISELHEFFGYGKASKAFEPSHPQYEQLKAAFADESRFAIARKGCLHSYFTPNAIVDNMWRALCRLGATEGRVLEPSCGSGQFIQRAHPSFDGSFVGVELDPTVGNLARLINPKAKIYSNQRFEHAKLAGSGYFDLVVGNCPYGQYKAHDTRFGSLSIHNYFVLRGLSELREGGLLAYVVTSWVMDSKNINTREQIAKMADLVAAVRLPSNAFASESAEVVTDILIFQKNSNANPCPSWLQLGTHSCGASINQYFVDHPERVIGTMTAPNAIFDVATCHINFSGDLDTELNRVLDAQTTQTCFHKVNPALNTAKETCNVTPRLHINRYEIFEQDGNVYQRLSDTIDQNGYESPTYQMISYKNMGHEKRAMAYIDVKDALKALLDAEQANESNIKLMTLREELNLLHNGFVKAFGPLSRTSNKSILSQCSMYLRTKALELGYVAPNKKEAIIESYNKAHILNQRVFSPFTPADSADNYEHALSISMNEIGAIDITRIAGLLNVSEQEVTDAMTDQSLIYRDPETGEWVDATSYLSGNVRTKLATAIDASKNTDQYVSNINALNKVIPADLEPEAISATLGAIWIPAVVYESFANHLMGANADFKVAYLADKWQVKTGGSGWWGAAKNEWGTNDRTFDALFENVLNGTPIKITFTDSDGNSRVNTEATAEANSKADEIKAEFDGWVWVDASRRQSLCRIYNDTFNSYVTPDYSNLCQSLTLEGCTMSPFDYQKKAIMRGVLQSNCLFDCAVGSGKSLIFAGVISILKRLYGQSERPVIVMPNPLVAQFSNTISATFPSMNVITIDSQLSAEKREEQLNTAVVTDFDLLILPESTFGALEAPREMQISMMEQELRDLRLALSECEDKNFNTKRIEKRIENKEAELEEIVNKPRLNSITWQDLNVTTFCADEIQSFKNIPFTSTYSNVRGMGSAKGSKKAFDFLIKVRDIQANNGRVLGGTGSSLSNSIVEAVSWLKTFAPDIEHTGLHRVDAFIRQFSAPVTEYTLAATGRSLKSTTTLKRFQNLSELLSIYRNYAEVLSSEQLKDQLPPLADGRPAIPPLKTGKIQSVVLPISEAQDAVFEQIVIDAQHIDNKDNNMLSIIDRARKASLDIRHINPYAINPDNIVNAICEKALEIHHKHKAFNGNLIIFSDRSCPARHKAGEIKHFRALFEKAEAGDLEAQQAIDGIGSAADIEAMLSDSFSLYDEIEKILTGKGLRVAVVHDYKTDAQKTRLKNEFNGGHIDVLIGSTGKLGTGWNLNAKLCALLHADLPLRPGDMEQRNGRLLRQQNQAYIDGHMNEVEIYTFSTERTLDSWFADLLDRKSKFIAQFNNGTLDTREYETEDETIDFATLSALLSGDTRMMELVKAQQELKRLTLLERSYRNKTYRLQDDHEYYQSIFEYNALNMGNFDLDKALAAQCRSADITCSGGVVENDKSALNAKVENISQRHYHYKKGDSVHLANVGNHFVIEAVKNRYSDWEAKLIGHASYSIGHISSSGLDLNTGRKLFNAILKSLIGLNDISRKASAQMNHAQAEIDSCLRELAKPFKHELDMKKLKNTIKELELSLAGETKADHTEKAA